MATSNNSVIISRIQNRRGLKQDLPQPLREGEIGFTTDSKQVFIGGSLGDTSSKLSVFETTSGAETITKSIANSRIIAFTVPHKKFSPTSNTFDGVSTSKLWNTTDETYIGSGLKVFRNTITATPTATVTANASSTTHTLSSSNAFISAGDVVTGNDITGTVTVSSFDTTTSVLTLSSNQSLTTANTLTFTPNNIKSIMTNEAFKASGLTVFKNNQRLVGDDVNITPSASKDYSFNSTTLGSNTHTLNFRVAPLTSDTVSINYYGNSAVTKAISNTNTIFVGATTQSFYNQYSIPSYRQLSNSLIRISETSGKGFIGLQFKHLAVYEDSSTISSPGSLSLGNLLASRNDMKSASEVSVSQSGATVTVGAGSLNEFSNTGTYDYIFFSDASNSWINGKALPVANVQTSSLEVTLPTGNSWQTARAVTASNTVSGLVTITGNIEGLGNNDYVTFTGSNATSLANTYQISNITSSSFQVAESGVSAISGNLDFINHGSNNDLANVQIISSDHGQTVNSTIQIYGSSDTGKINNATFTINNDTVTTNTFFITGTANVTSNVTGSSNVLVTESTANYTPVISYDLSSFTTLPTVIGNISNSVEFLDMAYIPSFTNKVYVSTKASFDSVTSSSAGGGIEFRLHNDSSDTLGTLGLTAGNKTRQNNTVKAKLENWLNGVVIDKNVNLFTSVNSSDKYSTGTTNIDPFNLNIQTRSSDNVRYIEFATREEAQAFNYIVNQVYFGTANPEIKGLVNIETNIELLTSQTAGGGAKVTTYDDLEDDVITNSGSLQSLSKKIDTADYDSFIVDYTVKYDGTTDGNYRRIGTMYLNVFNNSLTSNTGIIFQDLASDIADTLTGNVTFSAEYDSANTDIVLKAVNTTNKNLAFNYITRRWSS